MNEIDVQPLNLIVGSALSSVEFVRDYVQLRFDGPYLTAITTPVIQDGKNLYERTTSGYCDVLCKCIGITLRNAFILPNKEIHLEFDNGIHITISLKPEDYFGPEAAIFSNGEQDLWVW
jgi:hypothetical protein